jgi:hypothetical protein
MKLYYKPEYLKSQEKFQTYKDFYEGDAETMRQSKYLIPHELEVKLQGGKLRQLRESRTEYTNFVEPVLSIYTSLFFKKPPTIPKEVEEMLGDEIDDIDGEGNSLVTFMRDQITLNYLLYGQPIVRINSLGEKPKTKGEEATKSFRPYLEILDPLSVVDWQIETEKPESLGKLKFLRFEYVNYAPRERASDSVAPEILSKEYYLNSIGQLEIQRYKVQKDNKTPTKDTSKYSDSREWVKDGDPQVFSEWREIPIAAIFGNPSWVKDVIPQAKKLYNLESTLDNIHLFQAHQRQNAIGNIELDKIPVSEFAITVWPEGTTFHTEQPVNTTAIESRIEKVKDNLFKIALNQVKQVSSDSKAVQSDQTLREEKEYTLALIQSEIEAVENLINRSIEIYAKYKGDDHFVSEIRLSKDLDVSDFDRISKAFLMVRDELENLPTVRKLALKRFVKELDLSPDDLTTATEEIDSKYGQEKERPQAANTENV